jgi:hypothetical protein
VHHTNMSNDLLQSATERQQELDGQRGVGSDWTIGNDGHAADANVQRSGLQDDSISQRYLNASAHDPAAAASSLSSESLLRHQP